MAYLPRFIFLANRACAEFLLVDLDLGITFLEVAETSMNPETVQRNLDNALVAYRSSIRFLPRLTLTAEEEMAIEEKLIRLETRLESLGIPLTEYICG